MFFDGMPGSWEPVPLAQAAQRYDLGEASYDSVHLADLFGDEPEHFYVHTGNLVVDGPLALGNLPGEDDDTVYVVDGDLTVHGPVGFRNLDVYTSLYVTGTVTAQDLVCLWDSCLFVGGSLHVGGLLATSLTDAGHLVVKDRLTCPVWLDGRGRGAIYVDPEPGTRFLGDADHPLRPADTPAENVAAALRPEFLEKGHVDVDEIHRAVLSGRPVLR
ncbi:hypothetical protein ACFQO7_34260 [Catellatospora aurea]|uniref:Polymer-forming protein n=1 Tax=Catellatospora aurea TaxID=1337874 RepID=A0ABW2H8C4_9ACTN